MERRTLGGTGISVSSFALGAMMFGAFGNTDHEDAVRILPSPAEGGTTLIDPADIYAGGESETIVGKALTTMRREDVVVATKFRSAMGADANEQGGSRRWIVAEVEDSLRRL